MKPIKLFISYSHQDEELCVQLKSHLRSMERKQLIEFWYDRKIVAGSRWDDEIKQKLEGADVILFLISPDFMASDYIYNVEIKEAMERYETGAAYVVPIMLRPYMLEDTDLEEVFEIQGLPTDMKPVVSWPNRDSAFVNIAKGLRKLFVEINQLHNPDPHMAGHFCDALKFLDYGAQRDFVYRYIVSRKQKFGTFMIHGRSGFCYRWLLQILMDQHQIQSKPLFIDIQKSNVCNSNQLMSLLQVHLDKDKLGELSFGELTPQQVEGVIKDARKVLLNESQVLVLLNPMNLVVTGEFTAFRERFWLPLCREAQRDENDHRLLLFLVETTGAVDNDTVHMSTEIEEDCDYNILLKVPEVTPFTLEIFLDWLAYIRRLPEPEPRDTIYRKIQEDEEIYNRFLDHCRNRVPPVHFIGELFSALNLRKEDFENEWLKF